MYLVLLVYLAKLFKKYIDQDIFPFDFKAAYVIPISKTLFPKPPDKVCPISLLSVFSKLVENLWKICPNL